jgi:16S rRNA processing protein RimM
MPTGRIQLGVIGRAHGVRGLVKLTSHTADPADLTAYGPLSDTAGRFYDLHWVAGGVAEVSVIVDGVAVKVTDRAQAEKLTNTRLYVDRSGRSLGAVSVVHDYGAGASFEIIGSGAPLIIPFTAACVPMVDIAAGRLIVVLPDEIIVAPEAGQPA